jgi:hypothetical protein
LPRNRVKADWSGVLRFYSALLTVLFAGVSMAPSLCLAQAGYEPRKHDSWARFKPGAWQRVRAVAQTFDETGKLEGGSSTVTTTTLESVNSRHVTLRLEVTINIGGKEFDSPPRRVRKGFNGEVNGETAKIADDGSGSVTIGEQRIPCQIRRATIEDHSESAPSKRVSTVYFSERVPPFEFRSETVCTDREGKKLIYRTDAAVIAFNLPYKVLTEIQTVAFVRTVHTSATGKTITVEVHSPEVPGGVVAHSSREMNGAGRVVRRSVLELVDYGIGANGTDSP